MLRATPLLLLFAVSGCVKEYHPEYHPETVYSYVQNIRVEEPRPPPPPSLAPTIVIVMAPPVQPVAPRVQSHARARTALTAMTAQPAPVATFQTAPAFVADDHTATLPE